MFPLVLYKYIFNRHRNLIWGIKFIPTESKNPVYDHYILWKKLDMRMQLQ